MSRKVHGLNRDAVGKTTCGPAQLDRMLTDARAAMAWLREGSSVPQQQTIRDFAKSRAKALKDIKAGLPMRQRAAMPRIKRRREAPPSLNYTRRGFRIRTGVCRWRAGSRRRSCGRAPCPQIRRPCACTGTVSATGTPRSSSGQPSNPCPPPAAPSESTGASGRSRPPPVTPMTCPTRSTAGPPQRSWPDTSGRWRAAGRRGTGLTPADIARRGQRRPRCPEDRQAASGHRSQVGPIRGPRPRRPGRRGLPAEVPRQVHHGPQSGRRRGRRHQDRLDRDGPQARPDRPPGQSRAHHHGLRVVRSENQARTAPL